MRTLESDLSLPYTLAVASPRADRLRSARIASGFETAAAAARVHGWSQNSYYANENGNAPYSFSKAKVYGAAFGVRPEWLYDGASPLGDGRDGPPPKLAEPMAPIIGRVGAETSGLVLFAMGQAAGDLAPIPPGGTHHAVALEVAGYSMPGIADDGALIYFEDQRTRPTPDMLGQMVVVETEVGEVLVKRLQRGSRSGLFDLESLAGPTLRDRRLRWAAHITAIIPPHHARRVIRRAAV